MLSSNKHSRDRDSTRENPREQKRRRITLSSSETDGDISEKYAMDCLGSDDNDFSENEGEFTASDDGDHDQIDTLDLSLLTSLPTEIFVQIVIFMKKSDKLNMRLVSTFFKDIVNIDNEFWLNEIRNVFTGDPQRFRYPLEIYKQTFFRIKPLPADRPQTTFLAFVGEENEPAFLSSTYKSIEDIKSNKISHATGIYEINLPQDKVNKCLDESSTETPRSRKLFPYVVKIHSVTRRGVASIDKSIDPEPRLVEYDEAQNVFVTLGKLKQRSGFRLNIR